nr:F-box/LRR-repeat protein 25-like [Tanacetum cinerariifolium]
MIPMIPCTPSTVSIPMQTAITPAALKEMIPKGFASQVNNTIEYAINCKVQYLNLSLWGCFGYILIVLDELLLINSYFTHLNLSCNFVNPTGAFSWKILQSLSLSKVNLNEYVSSLVEASLDHTDYDNWILGDVKEEMRQLLVLRLRHVKHLKLGMMLLEVLYRLEAEGFIIPSNIQHAMDDGPKDD